MLRLYDDFLLLLRERAGRWPWWILPSHELRSETVNGDELDPITAMYASLYHRVLDIGSYREAARELGLDLATADAIAQAADLADSYNAHVREDLVSAVDLHERWAPEGRWHDQAFHAQPYPHNYDRPIRRGSGSPGAANAVWKKALWKFITPAASAASHWRLSVRIAEPRPALSISSGCGAMPEVNSSGFSVGVSQPGCDFALERLAAD